MWVWSEVAAIDAPRGDDAERRFLYEHGPDLHRARVRAQNRPRAIGGFREIERVVVLPRRMLGWDVEGGEIVEVGLNVRPLGDPEAHVGKYFGDLVSDLADWMDATLCQRTFADRERHVGALAGELRPESCAGQHLAPRFERRDDAFFQTVDCLAVILALFRGQRSQPPHQLGDAALSPERGNPHLFELAKIGSARDRVK